MKDSICAIGGATLLLAIGAANPARADICAPPYAPPVAVGKYLVQNNRWNGNVPGRQCINVIDQSGVPGFTITQPTGSAPTNGGPVSYPVAITAIVQRARTCR